jgi:metal-responsive CopG/Arc/MetJ family transcriptional regulator
MATVKTAISIDEDLFAQVDSAASEMAISRSRLIAISLQEYFRRRESRRLLEEINRTYTDEAQQEDLELARALQSSQRRIAEGNP